jgi:hypothetical protein
MTTPILGLPEITLSQKSKYATHNEALRELEALTTRVLSRTTTAEPVSPAEGDAYILPASSTGTSWAGNDGKIGIYRSAAWAFRTVVEGVGFWINDEDLEVRYDGSAFIVIGSPLAL